MFKKKMIEYTLTIGLFDATEEKQIIFEEEAEKIIADILIDKYNIFAFTMIKCDGFYKMESTNHIIKEPSIRVEIASRDLKAKKIMSIVEELKNSLNQETIMIKRCNEIIKFN